MRGIARIVAAALGVAGAVVFGAALVPSGAGGGTTAAVSLQVAPRGPGTVSGTLVATGEQRFCGANSFGNACEWLVEAGTAVALTATADGAGSSFAGWSEPGCGPGATCTITVDGEASIAALFSPVRLGVFFSGDDGGASVTPDPEGRPCTNAIALEELCREYPANTRVTLRLTPGSTQFRGWSDLERTSCEPTTSTTCTVLVADEPTSVGARFDDGPVNLPPTIDVHFRLRKSGDGRGRVTASNLDCGATCSAKFGFGKRITLAATEEGGSFFGGWGGVCADAAKSCTLPAGPVTSVTAVFRRDVTPPTAPGRPRLTRRLRTTLRLAWKASTDNVGVARYRVYRNRVAVAETRGTSFTLRRLKCGRRYAVGVEAVDTNGNRSTRSTTRMRTRQCARRPRR